MYSVNNMNTHHKYEITTEETEETSSKNVFHFDWGGGGGVYVILIYLNLLRPTSTYKPI